MQLMELKKIKKRNYDWGSLLMILPSYVIYVLFILLPIFMAFSYSFTNFDLYKQKDFVGFANYARLLQDPTFLVAVKNTFIYAFFTIIPPIAIGMIIAVVLNDNFFGQKISRISFFTPHITSMVTVSMVWLWIYNPSFGILNVVLKSIGLKQQSWLMNENLALASIIVMSIWKSIGYNMIIYLANLQTIPASLYEAATTDGASSVTKFFKITIPLLKPTTFFLFVISSIRAFNVFEQVNVMTGGGPMNSTTTIIHQLYRWAFEEFQMGYASSMAVFVVIITLVLTLVNFKYGNKSDMY